MNQRAPNHSPDRRPPVFHKSIYALDQFAADVTWLTANADEVYAVFVQQALPPALREAIMLSVAYENRCRYCAFMHGEWAIEVGLEADVEQELITLDPDHVSDRMWAACLYARRRAAVNFGPVDDNDRRLLRDHFAPREQYLIEVVARTMNVANRVGNTFDAFWSRLHGRAAPDSHPFDELFFTLLFVASLPVGAAVLTALTGHHPLDVLSRFVHFSALFQRRVADGSLPSVRDIDC